MGSRILRHSWFDSGYTLMLQFTDLPEIHSRPLSFGRETHVPCVGPASPPGSEHSGPSWASLGSDWPPLRGRDGHLSSTYTPITSESQGLTEDCARVDSSYGLRHGYVHRRWPGFSRRSIRAHTGILSIAAKIFTIPFFNSV